MKKVISLITILLAAMLLTACSTVYVPQENINLNYNNLSAGNSSYWLEKDGCYYSNDSQEELHYIMKTEKGNTSFDTTSPYGRTYLQGYGDFIYYVRAQGEDIEDNFYAYDIYQYSIPSKTSTFITSADNFDTFFADATHIYIINGQENFNGYRYTADVISLETLELITQIPDIYACGMRNQAFTYLKDTKDGFEIFEYSPKTNKSQKTAGFTLPITQGIEIYQAVNFTSEVMMLESHLTESEVSKILIYNFKSEELKTIDLPYCPIEIVAYENHAFCTMDDWENGKFYLYSLDLNTFELLQLGKIHEDKSLFVTSDKDVYLCGWDDEIIHYNLDGTKEQVLVKEKK